MNHLRVLHGNRHCTEQQNMPEDGNLEEYLLEFIQVTLYKMKTQAFTIFTT
jgi:hypothetical protein